MGGDPVGPGRHGRDMEVSKSSGKKMMFLFCDCAENEAASSFMQFFWEGGDFLGFDLLVAVANSPIAGSYLEMVDVSSNVENDQIEA